MVCFVVIAIFEFRTRENDLYWKLSMGKRELNEEFFNISKDDECMINLAIDPELAELKQKMKVRMKILLVST